MIMMAFCSAPKKPILRNHLFELLIARRILSKLERRAKNGLPLLQADFTDSVYRRSRCQWIFYPF
jgi:hypothetical protein